MKSTIIFALLLLGLVLPLNGATPATGFSLGNSFQANTKIESPRKPGLFKTLKTLKTLRAHHGEKDANRSYANSLIWLSLGMIAAVFIGLIFFTPGFFTAVGLFGIGFIMAIAGLRKNRKSAAPSRLLETLGIISLVLNGAGFLGLLAMFVGSFILWAT